MIDGSFKAKMDMFWNKLGMILVKLRLTPNMVTLSGLGLVVLSCLYFILFKNSFYFGLFLALSFTTDALDGAVARLTGKSTEFGSYMDAVVDRYQEIFVYFTIAYVRDYWLISFWAITGSLLVSYNKARVAIETPISNKNWPDLLERMERLVLISAGLLIDGLVPGRDVLWYMVVIIGVLAHFTAVQRFFRARKYILKKKSSSK
ncbi:MAG: CDP-alcohol phosphatidyltransferase family protein [Desulfobacterales bacterium]|nr:MAG: CDP-alcohol phosphatidyltransferase family protein [Desulfobacterales bacterium]